MSEKIAFLAADTDSAQAALHELTEIYGQCDFKEADYIVALGGDGSVSYTHLRAHETRHDLVCRLLLEKKKKTMKPHSTNQ